MILHLHPAKRDALKLSNKIRAEFGHKPKKRLEKGYRNVSNRCPIANTINEGHVVSVGGRVITVDGKHFRTTPGARTFIHDFDLGIIR